MGLTKRSTIARRRHRRRIVFSRASKSSSSPPQPRPTLEDGYYPSRGVKDSIIVAYQEHPLPPTTAMASSTSSSSTSSTSPSPVRRHRAAAAGVALRKHTIPFGLMCRKIRESGVSKNRPARIVLRRSTSQSSQ